jgi:hypothetical protein
VWKLTLRCVAFHKGQPLGFVSGDQVGLHTPKLTVLV